MPTEVVGQGHYTEIAALSYLERNDFKQLHVLLPRLIVAKDGTRQVMVWIDIHDGELPHLITVPLAVVSMALAASSRLDVLKFLERDNGMCMTHVMNVLVES